MGLYYKAEYKSHSVSVAGVTVSTFSTITTALAFFAARILRQQSLTTSVGGDVPAPAKLRAEDYYPIIVRAITILPSNEREARQKLYDRARAVLTSRLNGQDHSRIKRERRALELAIRRVEANMVEREWHRFRDPPGYQRAAVTTVPSSPPRPTMSVLTKVLLAILAGSAIALAIAQLIHHIET